MDRPFKIDSEFSALIPPASPEEVRLLTESVKRDGILHPLILWREQKILLDGHTRYKLATKLGIPHPVKHLNFDSREEARNWLINHQLGRRNITSEQRTYLLGKLYNQAKQDHGGDRASRQNDDLKPNGKTADQIAEQHHIGSRTVERAGKFAEAVDALEEDSPGVAAAVLAGESEATAKDIIAAVHLPAKKRKKAAKQIARGEKPTIEDDEPRPSGKQTRDPRSWQRWEEAFGKLKRATDDVQKSYPAEKFSRAVHGCLNEAHISAKEWRRAVK